MRFIKILFLVLLLSSSYTSLAQPMTKSNVLFCHSCNTDESKSASIQKAITIGFYDPINELERPTTVYIFDFNNKSIRAFDVWNKYNLFTGSPYTVTEAPQKVPSSYYGEWVIFVDTFTEAVQTPFYSNYSGYDFLRDPNIQNKVFDDAKESWYGFVIGAASMVEFLDNFVGVIPNDFFLQRMTINFEDNVRVTVSIVDGKFLSVSELLADIPMEYVKDSAYVVSDEDGTRYKIPDDYKELLDTFIVEVDGSNSAGFEGYLGVYGFHFSGGVGTSSSFPNLICNRTEEKTTDENGMEKITYTYRCIYS